MADIDESEGDTVISSGGVGTGTCFFPHGQLSGGANGGRGGGRSV
jgi:hypothetical protein